MKSYRDRNLSQRCQLAKDDGGGNPLRDQAGNPVLDHAGLWFLKISGNDNHDRKRVVPEDHVAFFALKAKEIEEALRADGVADAAVTAEEVYAEYARTFTRPAHTFAPAGKPEEFSLVVPKGLCVNFCSGFHGGNALARPSAIPAEQTSIFARLRAARGPSNGDARPAAPRSSGKRRKAGATETHAADDRSGR